MRSVDTPGPISPTSMSRHSAASRPALRMPSNAAGPWILICPVLRSGAEAASTYVMALMNVSREESGCKPPVEPQCKHAAAQRKQVANWCLYSPVHHRNRRGDLDTFGRDLAAPCQDFDAFLSRAVEGSGISRVDVARYSEALGRRNLDDKEEHGAGAAGDHQRQIVEMLGAAHRDAIGKLGEVRRAHQVHVLDLEIAGRALAVLEHEVGARVDAVFHLAPDRRI